MKIIFINGSPKARSKDTASQVLLNDLKTFLPNEAISELHLNKLTMTPEEMQLVQTAQAIVFSFPLYVDSVPAHLLLCLYEMEKCLHSLPIRVYTISNNGFFEGVQNRHVLDVIKHWSLRTALKWGQGLGVGGGGMIVGQNIPIGKGPKKNLGKAMKTLSENILHDKSGENLFVNMNVPRFIYHMMAHIGWCLQAWKNSLKCRDLSRKL